MEGKYFILVCVVFCIEF